MSKIDFTRKQIKVKEKRDNRPNDYKQLRYTKLVAEVVKRIVRNDSKILKKNDLSEICIKVYGQTNKIKEIRVRKMLDAPIVKNDINEALMRFYTNAGFNQETAEKLIKNVLTWIDEKKDTGNAIKMIEKYETAANLAQKSASKATYSETTDFSRIGKDGNPALKVTKTLEMSTDQSIIDSATPDGGVINSTAERDNV